MVEIDPVRARPIPRCVRARWRDVPLEAWRWVSPRRLRADYHVEQPWQRRPDHGAPNRSTLVVTDAQGKLCEGYQIEATRAPIWLSSQSEYLHPRRDDAAIWAHLWMRMMGKLGLKVACQDGTPVFDEQYRSLVGNNQEDHTPTSHECVWCGKALAEHKVAGAASARRIPPYVLANWPGTFATAWRWVSPLRLRTDVVEPYKRVLLVAIDPQSKLAAGNHFDSDLLNERYAYGRIRMDLMLKVVAHKTGCHDGVPIDQWDNWRQPMLPEYSRRKCRQCGRTPDEHESPAPSK